MNIGLTLGPFEYGKKISDADMDRLLAAVRNEMGNPSASPKEAADFLAEGIWKQLLSSVHQYETQTAIKSAVRSVSPIDLA